MIGGLPSQMKLSTWCRELQQEDDLILKQFLFDGILNGFEIVDNESVILPYDSKNYLSATQGEAKSFFDRLIRKELNEFKYVQVAKQPHCIHSVGAVRKSNNEFRPITDCRRPIGESINNYMLSTAQEFQFKSIDDICEVLKKGSFLATIDIKAAYRSISVRPEHWQYQGIRWELEGEELFLQDTHLCFGLKCAPYIFSTISNFVVRCMRRRGINNIFCYLDDYVVLSDSFESCQSIQMEVIHLLIELGFAINWEKCSTPAKTCKYLGIIINPDLMKLSLPAEKVGKFYNELKFF